jgi:hypothetical protein
MAEVLVFGASSDEPSSARLGQFSDPARIRGRNDHGIRGAVGWVSRVRRDVEQRHEREGARAQLRVRHDEVLGFETNTEAPENVEVDDTRSPALVTDASELALEIEEALEERLRRESRQEPQRGGPTGAVS